MQIFLTLFMRPADELVAWGVLPGGRAKTQQCDQAITGINPIAQLRAGQGFMTRIVVAVYVFIPQARVRATANPLKF
jgi:hypothetical protein